MTAAYCLARGGAAVDLYEASGDVGGMSRSFDLWEQRVDLGPHRFFAADERVRRLWFEMAGSDYDMVDRLTRIYYRGRLFHYPLQPLDVLRKLGPIEAARCLASYARERVRPAEHDDSFEAWVVRRFGRRLFEIFFETYSEKLWGISCRELDADFAAQRIREFDLAEALRHALLGRGRSRHRTLADRFAYPRGGTGTVYERMGAAVSRTGRLLLRAPVRRVVTAAGRAIGLERTDGTFEPYDAVVSSMPLPALVRGLPEAPDRVKELASALTFRNTTIVYLHVAAERLFPDNWLYVHAPQLAVGRVTNFRNWSPSLQRGKQTTILAMEYWSGDTDEAWTRDDETIADIARREMASTGLLAGARVLDHRVVRVPRCYPVYRRGYREILREVEEYLRTVRGLVTIGRYGAFKYNNQDHSILAGMLAADGVLAGTGTDVWGVNTDFDRYQESDVWESGTVESERASALPRARTKRDENVTNP